MNEKHEFTSDQKLKWWGYGEWVEEPDEVNFEHEGFECKVLRMMAYEDAKGQYAFGGHLCGYVFIPEGHILHGTDFDWDSGIDFDVHGGITHYGSHLFGKYCIGFDCAHSGDYIPSLQYLYNKDPQLKAIRDKHMQDIEDLKNKFNIHDSPIFRESYKNISYAIAECKSLAEQVKNYKPEEAKNDTIRTI